MTGDQETLITPPPSFWGSRATLVRDRADDARPMTERDPVWDELVAWFEQEREWCDLVQRIEGSDR